VPICWAKDFEYPDTQRTGAMLDSRTNVATGIDWAFAPDWLTIEQACFLSGHDRDSMLEIIEVDGVDLDIEGLIEKRSLWEFQEALVLVRHWHD
jgi:hypothetical protein